MTCSDATSGWSHTSTTVADLTALAGEADLIASVAGIGAKARVGETDLVNATVTNDGPDQATNVAVRLGVPRGLEYGYVKKPGEDWTCTISSGRFILCTAPSLASGASATLSAGLYAVRPMAEKVRVAVRVESETPDPARGNNEVVDLQRIGEPKAPAPPSARDRARALRHGEAEGQAALAQALSQRRDARWFQVSSKYNLWAKTTNVTYHDPNISRGELQGAYTATMWSWEGGHSRTIRFEMKNTLMKYSGLDLGANLSKTGKTDVADDARNSSASFSKQWAIEADDADAFMKGTWKFVRKGRSKNVTVKYKLV